MARLNTIGKKIMRRVYYAFALKVVKHPLTIHAMIFVASMFVLSRLIHVAAIINNIKSVQVGELGNYIFNTFTHTEFLTLVCVGVIVFTLLSLPLRLALPRGKFTQMA